MTTQQGPIPFGGSLPRPLRAALEDAVRLAALAATDLHTPDRAEALRPIVRLAARALKVPVAQLNVVTAESQRPVVACAPTDPHPERWEVPVGLDSSYCQHVVASGEPLIVEDARVHPLVRESGATREAGVVAYVGVPLRAPEALGAPLAGQVLGTVCVVDMVPRRWTAEDIALLAEMAEAVTAELAVRARAVRRAAEEVAEAARTALQVADAALAESETRFHTLADSMPQLAWMADESGSIFWYNRRWYEYTGAAAPETSPGSWYAFHHPDHLARVASHFRLAVEARESWEDTFPLRGADGAYRWFLSRALPVRDGAGRVRWFGTNTDITERFDAEAERERLLHAEHEARLAAEEAGRARTRFLATMSHELRTPLNAIGGYTELMEMGLRGPITEAQRADFARIRRAQQHLLGIINDILNFARLESGTVTYELTDVPVTVALQEVSALVLPQAAGKGLSYRVESCPPALAVRADREKLRQVLVNMLSNAVKFTSAPGAVRVCCDADERGVHIAVQDSGIGIPPDKLDTVFEPFVQVRADLTRTAEGTGLGLAISRDLVQGMGGTLTVTSEPGQGSRFVLHLPRGRDLTPDEAATLVPSGALRDAEAEVRELLRREGVFAVLRYLNARTMHRYTGLYRFDGPILRNVALFDRETPTLTRGQDSPLGETYCSIVGAGGATVTLADSRRDGRMTDHPAREVVVSYCGALVRATDGTAAGTLCSFDVEARPVPSHEIPLLEAVAPLLAEAVREDARRLGSPTGESGVAEQTRETGAPP